MTRARRIASAAAPLLAAALAAAARAQDPAVATVQLPAELTATDVTPFDVDGDRRADLVIAGRDATTGRRSVRVYLRQAGAPAFVAAPSRPPDAIDPDVIAFTFCDCAAPPGNELVLLTAEQVVAVTRADDGTPSYARLARHDLVWPVADPDRVLPLPTAAIDFDGDGATDLLLPRADGWSVLLQGTADAARFARRLELSLPTKQTAATNALGARAGSSGGSIELRIGSGDERAPLVRATARTAPCHVVDLDGDGRRDLVSWRDGRVIAGLQTAAGELLQTTRALPLPANRLQLVDPAFEVQFAALDADARADLVLTTSARRDDEIEVRVDRFATPLGGDWPERPDGRLRVQTLALPPQLVDVDGDGDLDLVLVSVRTAALRALGGGSAPTALDAQLSVFANDGSRFATPALLVQTLALAAGSEQLRRPFLAVRAAAAGQPADVLLRIGGTLERRELAVRGGNAQLSAAMQSVPVPPAARVVAFGDDGAELCVVTAHEVRHVRFR